MGSQALIKYLHYYHHDHQIHRHPGTAPGIFVDGGGGTLNLTGDAVVANNSGTILTGGGLDVINAG